MKQLALQNIANNPILQGVRKITGRQYNILFCILKFKELRQTPYRRWSNSTHHRQSYEEKRRQWKAEMKRRLQGEKIPARVIPPLLIRLVYA